MGLVYMRRTISTIAAVTAVDGEPSGSGGGGGSWRGRSTARRRGMKATLSLFVMAFDFDLVRIRLVRIWRTPARTLGMEPQRSLPEKAKYNLVPRNG